MLQKEINVWKKLRHPNILQFFGACAIADPPFAVCAYKPRGNAINYLENNPSADRCKLVSSATLDKKTEYLIHQHSDTRGMPGAAISSL